MAIGPKISSRCPIPDSPTAYSSIPSKEDSASEQQGKVATKSVDAKGRNSNGGIAKSIWAAILNLLAQKEETLMQAFQHLDG
ncbi:hypothetical protein ZIOFF_057051 [Zingiber officinale]|uniref:Uncharacterized protein n=1 Tax=Zingiber officinale TaxID=94328 RepID=A0A8J5FHS2_ZINOF|nr:hypothetical protein ZIOFF_057051 [Zingiber officinale]